MSFLNRTRLIGFAAAVLAGTMLPSGCSTPLKFPHKRSAQPQYARPTYPGLKPQQKSKSWLGSWGESDESKKDKTVGEWMKKTERPKL